MPTSYSSYCNPAGTVVADRAGFVRIKWHAGERRTADFRAVLEQALRTLEQQGTGKVLLDQRLMPAMAEAEQTWLLTGWLPRAMAAGYRYAAWLPSRNDITRWAAQHVVEQIGSRGPQYHQFQTEAEAVTWLLSRP